MCGVHDANSKAVMEEDYISLCLMRYSEIAFPDGIVCNASAQMCNFSSVPTQSVRIVLIELANVPFSDQGLRHTRFGTSEQFFLC